MHYNPLFADDHEEVTVRRIVNGGISSHFSNLLNSHLFYVILTPKYGTYLRNEAISELIERGIDSNRNLVGKELAKKDWFDTLQAGMLDPVVIEKCKRVCAEKGVG